MNHLKQIAARLPEYGLDAMLLNSEPGNTMPWASTERAMWW